MIPYANALTTPSYISNKSVKFIEILIKSGIDVDYDTYDRNCFLYIHDEYLCDLILEHSKNKHILLNKLVVLLSNLPNVFCDLKLTKDQLVSKFNFMTKHKINLLNLSSIYLIGSNDLIEVLLDKIEQTYSKEELIKFILSTDCMFTRNILQYALCDKNLSIYNFIMNKLPKDKQIELLMHKNGLNESVLMNLISGYAYEGYYQLIDIIYEILKTIKNVDHINEIASHGNNVMSYLIVEPKKIDSTKIRNDHYQTIYDLIITLINLGVDTNIIYKFYINISDKCETKFNLVELIKFRNPPFADKLINYLTSRNVDIAIKNRIHKL